MATYTVTTANWNNPSFWSSISESGGEHTFDFVLGSAYSVVFDEAAGTITITNGGTTFVIGEAGYAGPSNVNMGGTTQLAYFTELLGTSGGDTMRAGDTGTFLRGHNGDDSLIGGAGNDTLRGDGGNDTMVGGAGSDFFYIEQGFTNETIFGGESAGDADVISMIGTFASATVNFTGNDGGTLTSGSGTITFDEIEGIGLTEADDVVNGASATGNLWIEGDGGNDSIRTGSGDDVVYGGDGDDTIQTGGGSDTVYGGFGADSIIGNGGSDELWGGSGIDTIIGGGGNDTIFGDSQELGRDAGAINGFTFDSGSISSTGTDIDGNGSIGSFAIYDNVGTTSDGTVVQAKLTLIGSEDPTVSIEYDDGVRLNYDSDVPAGTEVTFQMEFFDQATGEPIQLDGALTFKDIDTTSESVTFAATDASSVAVSSTPATDLTVINTPEVIGVQSNNTSSTSADQDHWAQFAVDDQNTVEFTVTTRGAGTIYNFGSDSFTNPPVTTASAPEPQNDSLVGNNGDDLIYGGIGDDTINGGNGQDTIYGGTGDDIMRGNADEDVFVIEDGFGSDTVDGDEGTNTGLDFDTLDMSGLSGPVTVIATGAEAGTASDGTDTLSFTQIEAIKTTDFADRVDTSADSAGLFISTGDGTDRVRAGSGDDTVFAGDGNDGVALGAGNDSYGSFSDASGGDDTVFGDAGDDYIIENTGNDSIDGGTGNDTLTGGAGTDTILGGDDADVILITDDHETDIIEGGEGGTDFDTVIFSNFISSGGVDVVFTGDEAGSYNYTATPGSGTFTEIEALTGTGNADSMDATASGQSQFLSGNGGNDALTGGSGDDILAGGDDDDTLDGGAGDDVIGGDAGNDTFTLSDGADTMSGGTGNDTLTAGSGDSIDTGAGDDVINVDLGDLNGGTIFVDGGSGDETLGDTLNITGPATITPGGTAGSGTVDFLDGTTLTFSNIENVNYVPCFTPGTRIKTDRGEVRVEKLRLGDRVLTRDNGYQEIHWIGSRHLSHEQIALTPSLGPILIRKGALGPDMPERDMTVSPQHRILHQNAMTELLFGEEEVLIAARNLTHLDGIEAAIPAQGVQYIHFMCARHEIVMSDGCWTESFQPGEETLGAISDDARAELYAVFPDLRTREGRKAYSAARQTLKSYQSRALLAA